MSDSFPLRHSRLSGYFSYVALTKRGHTAKIPLLIGTNKVCSFWTTCTVLTTCQDEGSEIVVGEPTAYEKNITNFA
jgi:hypothetical protein